MRRSFTARTMQCARTGALGLMTGTALLLSTSIASANSGDGAYYFFGDSATGQGNYSAITGQVGEDHSPYSSHNGHQRESNGLIWAEMMGRDVDLILDTEAMSENLNFAISGAHMTAGGDLTEFGIETGVRRQTELFGALVDNGTLAVNPEDTFFLLAGANDFLDRLEIDDPANEIIADVAQAARENVLELTSRGAKTIILSEIQPIQFAPEFSDEPELQQVLGDLMREANQRMLAAVTADGLPEDVNIVTMKYSDFITHITSNAQALGFDETATPCYNSENGSLCSTDKAEQNKYIFFDDLHLSEGAQRIEAQWFQSTLDAASGEASRQYSRIPDVAQFEMESVLRRIGKGRPNPEAGVRVYSEVLKERPLLSNGGLESIVETNFKGGVLGAETFVSDQVFIGGAFSYLDSEVGTITNGRYDTKSTALHGYAGIKPGGFDVRVGGAYGWLDVDDFARPTGVDLLTAQGETGGRFHDLYIRAGSELTVLGAKLTGDVSLHASKIKVDGFTEFGASGLALRYEDQARKSRRVEADLAIRPVSFDLGANVRIYPVADFNYRRELTDGDFTVTSQLIDNTANSSRFITDGAAPDRLTGAFGVDAIINERWTLGARYERSWADDMNDAEGVSISVRRSF